MKKECKKMLVCEQGEGNERRRGKREPAGMAFCYISCPHIAIKFNFPLLEAHAIGKIIDFF